MYDSLQKGISEWSLLISVRKNVRTSIAFQSTCREDVANTAVYMPRQPLNISTKDMDAVPSGQLPGLVSVSGHMLTTISSKITGWVLQAEEWLATIILL